MTDPRSSGSFPRAPTVRRRATALAGALLGLVAPVTLVTLVTLVASPGAGAAAAGSGVHPDRIVLGQSAPLSGLTADLGIGVRTGLRAAFAEANAAGGVHGRRLELVTLDDGYDPERAIANTRRLIDDGVFALVGSVGTPTSKAALPLAEAAGVPYIAPFTGAAFLRDPARTTVLNLRAGYGAETDAWMVRLVDELGLRRIAVLYQNDAFGQAGLVAVHASLAARGLAPVAEGAYERGTLAVKQALLEIRRAKPDAVVMVAPYGPVAEFVRLADRLRMDVAFAAISFVGTRALSDELGELADGLFVTQVVPNPEEGELPLVAGYRRALAAIAPDARPDFTSFEGYIAGRFTVQRLRRLGDEPTRAGLLDRTLASGRTRLGGLELQFGPNDNEGIGRVWVSTLDGRGGVRYPDAPAGRLADDGFAGR